MVIINAEREAYLRVERAGILESAGYEVFGAETAAAIEDLARQHAPGMILIGSFQEASAIEALAEPHPATSLESWGKVVIYPAGYATNNEQGRTMPNADCELVEPVDAFNLLNAIKTVERLRDTKSKAAAENQRLSALLNAMFDGYYEVDREWRIHDPNPVMVRHIERQSRHEAGQTIWELWPEIRGTLFETNYRRVMTERIQIQFEAPSVVQPGRHLELNCYPIPSGMAVCLRDITEKIARERALQRSNQQLLRANYDLQHFAYAVSHDLKEPARTVQSFSELLLRRDPANPVEAIRQDLEHIRAAANRMLEMITGLLAYSNVSDVDEPAVVRTEQAVHWAVANLDATIRAAGGEIKASHLPEVLGDFTQISRVFQNLIANSIKYRSPDRPPLIEISAEREGDAWRFTVADNGVGFEPQYAQRIFGMFQRLHGREYDGVGIGLATCKRIIERHGGRMWAQGQPHRGSQFCFTLPAAGETISHRISGSS